MTFDEWMSASGYAASTRRIAVSRVAALRRDRAGIAAKILESAHDRDIARRYARFLEEARARLDAADHAILEALRQPLPRRARKLRRKHEAVSHDEADWQRLVATLRTQRAPEAAVVLVIAATGLRIGDLLRLRREALSRALGAREGGVVTVQKGGAPRRLPVDGARAEWQLLSDRWRDGATVAEWICPASRWGAETPGGAYQRVRRHLLRTAEQLGLDGRAHLHRLRRTVAVRALGATGDVHLVQQLLGHQSLSATQVYTDELRSRELAALQQKLLQPKAS